MEQDKERKEFIKLAYESVNSDLKFAENKNTLLLTFNLALIATSVSFLYDDIKLQLVNKIFFVIFTVLNIIATFIACYSYLPLNKADKLIKSNPISGTQTEKIKLMFYQYNFNNYEWNEEGYEKCFNDIKLLFRDATHSVSELTVFEKQLIKQIVDLSHIANTKFCLFSYALMVELVSFVFLIAFLIIA